MYNHIVKNFYEVLRVRPNATHEQIKRAYLELVKKYHPDVFIGDKIYAEHCTAEITEAYSILKDPEKRRTYDIKNNFNIIVPKQNYWKEDSEYTVHTPRRNYEQEASRTYFKNAERKKPKKKGFVRNFFKSKFFLCIFFVISLELAIILLFRFIKL